MRFQDFINKGEVRKIKPDKELAKSLIKTVKSDLIYLNSVEITAHSSRKTVSNYYDVLRSILEAIANSKGYKIHSHEAFTYFLLEIGQEAFSSKFDRFRRIRNKINYYALDISVEEAKNYISDIKLLIKELNSIYFNEK